MKKHKIHSVYFVFFIFKVFGVDERLKPNPYINLFEFPAT